MPAKRTFGSARFRGPVQLDGGANSQGRPVPRFKEYVAMLSDLGEGIVAQVIHNTLGGEINWQRTAEGEITGTLAGAFSGTRTLVLSPFAGNIKVIARCISDDEIFIETLTYANATTNNFLVNHPIDIRVY